MTHNPPPNPATHRFAGRSRRWHGFLAATALSFIALLADRAEADRVNFAKYQEASSSTKSGDYGPEFAVDGIVSNFHSFRTTNTTNPQWLEVTFPRPVAIGSAHLYLGLDNDPATGLPSFKFQYYEGSAWVDVPGSAVTGNTDTERSVIFSSSATSDRFRLYTDENGNRTIRELALFPPKLVGSVEQGYPLGTDVRLSLANQRPTVASSIYTGSNYPKLAVDGYVDDTSRWLCANTSGQTLEVDLLDTHAIGSAHVYSGFGTSGALADFALEYWTGTDWTAIPGATITGNASTALVVPFSSNVSTSRIRLRTTSASYGRVRELLVFPPRSGVYPLGQDVTTSPPPTAKWNDFSDSTYRLKNGGPDNRLALVNGTVVYASPSTTATAIEWQLLLNHRDGSYRVRHIATGGCLAQGTISRATGTPVVVETYTGMPHQDWYLDFTNATQFRLINVYSGLALNPSGSNWSVGTPMVVTTPDAGVLQLWNAIYYTHYPKKGLGGNNYDGKNQLFGSWSYNWGRSSTKLFPFNHTFNSMQWGNYNWKHGDSQGPVDLIRNGLQASPKPTHLMGFNEPDHTDQSNMTTAQAIGLWPRLEALDAPLVGPCPASTFAGWQADFTSQADALGYRYDYIPYHSYGSPNASSLISNLQSAYTTFGRPIWLTEFSVVDWSGTANWTNADNYNFLAEFMWRAESLTWLKRYALFQFTEGGTSNDLPTSPRGNTWKVDGSLTPFGELYASWDAVTSVLPNKAYYVHNRGEYDRIRNPGVVSTPALVEPTNSGAGTQWFLTPGTTANTYRLISTRDGRPLRVSGTTVDLGTLGQTITSVEWRLVANQDGWYFIEHPATNKRLKDNGNGTFSMVAITTTTDNVKWRFVVPLNPESLGGAPSAIPQQVTTLEDSGAKAFTLEGGDADGNPLTYTVVTQPAHGTLSGTAPSLTYTPFANYAGFDSFTFRVNDGSLDSADATVSITVTGVNDAPVATPQSVTMPEDGGNKAITLAGSDIDGDPLTYSIVAGPTNGALGGTGRNLTYTPAANYNGVDTFTFKVNDGTVDSPAATVSITITPVNDAPVATPQSVTTAEDTALPITLSGTDIDGDPLTYTTVVAPTKGTLSGTGANRTYTPNANFNGADSFTFRVNDGTVNSAATATVSITVTAVNDAPVLSAISSKTVSEGALLTFTATATDVDLPANTLTYSLVGAPGGAAIDPATGVFTWTPTEAQGPGTFNFTARVSDGALTSDQAVAVTVNEVNVAPALAAILPKSVNEGVLLTFTATATDTDLPANTLAYSLLGAPVGASINPATGVFTWTPTEAQGPGTFNFTARVGDGTLTSDQPVAITVDEVNVAPALAAISPKTVNEGVLLSFTASATDADLPANTPTYSLVGAPSGAAIDPTTGVFTWTPTEAQGPGTFNFTARVSDGALTSDQAVAVTVDGVVGNPGDDADGDGLSNLVEYALGTSQTEPSPANRLPRARVIAGKLTVAYRRPANGGTPGVSYTFETNTQLSGTWTTAVAGVDYDPAIVDHGDGSETVTATFATNLVPGTTCFVRLAFSMP